MRHSRNNHHNSKPSQLFAQNPLRHRQTKRLKQAFASSTNNGKVYISKIQNSPTKNNETLYGKRIACEIDTRFCICRFSSDSDSFRVFRVVFYLFFRFLLYLCLRVEWGNLASFAAGFLIYWCVFSC